MGWAGDPEACSPRKMSKHKRYDVVPDVSDFWRPANTVHASCIALTRATGILITMINSDVLLVSPHAILIEQHNRQNKSH